MCTEAYRHANRVDLLKDFTGDVRRQLRPVDASPRDEEAAKLPLRNSFNDANRRQAIINKPMDL
jgi:hypothetical protein